ncbi:MAG: AAA family ATPase [Planctomycetes bacterium]|nr:AAA family ATPase [Planctomycetota bacterium]
MMLLFCGSPLVRFDAVIGAYLGQTAVHLRQLFHFAETTPCVLLLDELDALGKRRG